ncbi:XdhC family protein [Celeribacter arenosi]|uniref:XdhC family protein n=1 Tax=Celeribacter arenosi TaxID=792649 RepID=A0ABP7KI18_9RHOB
MVQFDPDAIGEIALKWHREGRGAVLATVVQTWGSAPRPVGSQLAVSGAGEIAGSVSGGCVEGAVVVEALELLENPSAKMLEFGVSDEDAFAVGLACGGTIRVFLEPVGSVLSEEILGAIVSAQAVRRPVAYVVNTASGEGHVAGRDAFPDRFLRDQSGFEDDGETFVAVHNPPPRLVVVGAVHIAQNLLPMARGAGFDVTLIDPRDAFASRSRFPDEAISDAWPDEALNALALDARTAVVTLTHDPKLDDPALMVALTSSAFYVGSLGSMRTHAKRVERLSKAGLTQAQIARLHAPVGLDIKARSPGEIAVSILAEVIAVMRGAAE